MGIYSYINDKSELDELKTLPDYCPLCKKSITPSFVLLHKKNDDRYELLCKCPNNECDSLFFSVYEPESVFTPFDQLYELNYYYPHSRSYKNFPDEITHLSPDFIEIYSQAHHAEQEKLDLICGVAYRKSLEYVLKDYIISLYPEEEEKIKKIHSIQHCINQYINDSDIKDMAERATWLGNDETHYIRKWRDKDINDLKNLIDLTIYFISMKIKAKVYKDEMSRDPK